MEQGADGFGARGSGKERSLTTTSAATSASTKSAGARTGKKAESAQVSKAQVSKSRPDPEETLKIVLTRLDDMKAEDTVTIDLRGKSSIADYMIVTTGRANRHVGAIAENVVKGLGEAGLKGVNVEGLPNCDWVLIDTGDVIAHVFRPEVRSFYSLEKMWTTPRSKAS
jgi:ribosome-associated protein